MSILRFPLARIAVAFIIGILLADHIELSLQTQLIIAGFILLVTILLFLRAAHDFIQRIYFGTAVFVIAVIFGIITVALRDSYNQTSHFIHKSDEINMLQLVIRERLKNTSSNQRYLAEVTQIDSHKSSGIIQVNIRRDSLLPSFTSGTILQVFGKIQKHKSPLNPDQFDYGRYLVRKGIHAQIYINRNDIKTSALIKKDIWHYADALRNRILKNISDAGFGKSELPVLSALVLGQRQELSPDVLRDYQYAGAIHILAVSGLHVGLVLWFLNSLLKPLPPTRTSSAIKLIIILVSLWGFAILASLSPSVVRAVTMFSFVAVGMHINRSTNIYHTLLVSMLIILLFQPAFLYDVGFQLSYIALFSILWIQPMLMTLWEPKYKILRYFWSIFTVSVAAQIGVLPIGIYYFHQFPGLFFITNLIVIPFLGIVMGLGIVLMLLASFGHVPKFPAYLLEMLIANMNHVISTIASAEKFVFTNIPLNAYILFSIYLFLIGFISWLKRPFFGRLVVTLIAAILLNAAYIFTGWYHQQRQQWIVLQMRNNSVIIDRFGINAEVTADRNRLSQWDQNTLQNYFTANYINSVNYIMPKNAHFVSGKKILVIDTAVAELNFQPDLILLARSPRINLERVINTMKPKQIIADGSNFKSYTNRWRKTCLKYKIPFHDTGEKGFYMLE